MFGANMSYEIGSDGEGMQHYEGTPLLMTSKPETAYSIAGEIINEILENALDIAAQVSDTDISWKNTNSNIKSSLDIQLNNVPDLKYSKHTLNMDKVCHNIIGDLVDQMGVTPTANISEIIKELNSIKEDQNIQQGKPDAEPLTVEMKKLLTEMLSPPYQVINYDDIAVKGGIGDHPNDSVITNVQLAEPETPKAVEKKSRVTDLVKNSPQLISEYLMMDEQAKQNQEEWEESEEKLLQVIELDYVRPGEEAFRVQKTICPEEIALPEDDDTDIFEMSEDDGVMDIIDLSSNAFKEEELQLSMPAENDNGAKGDECTVDNTTREATQSAAASGGTAVEYLEEKSSDLLSKVTSDKVEKIKKKKCNLRTKIWGFFKKGYKTQSRGSSTSGAKPLN